MANVYGARGSLFIEDGRKCWVFLFHNGCLYYENWKLWSGRDPTGKKKKNYKRNKNEERRISWIDFHFPNVLFCTAGEIILTGKHICKRISSRNDYFCFCTKPIKVCLVCCCRSKRLMCVKFTQDRMGDKKLDLSWAKAFLMFLKWFRAKELSEIGVGFSTQQMKYKCLLDLNSLGNKIWQKKTQLIRFTFLLQPSYIDT